jgi:hypothetical protein
MPNKIRTLPTEEIAENIIMSMDIETLQQYAYEEMLNWLNNIKEDEFMEVYGDSPKYWAAPTLREELEDIFDNHRRKVQAIASSYRNNFDTHIDDALYYLRYMSAEWRLICKVQA